MFEVKNVSFSYNNRKIFDDLSLSLPDKKITTLIGPNGSGKSTLFKLLTRTLKPEQGSIFLDEKNIWQINGKKFAQKVAILQQQNDLYDEITVLDLIKMGRLPYHGLLDDDSDLAIIDQLLDQLEITALKNKYVSQLSGGQQQRVWLAAALAQEPEYLFLDEPTTYLDLHFQFQFLKLIKNLNRQHKLTICMILHDLNQALQFSDQVILLKNGKVLKQGEPQEVVKPQVIGPSFDINCEIVQTEKGPFLMQN